MNSLISRRLWVEPDLLVKTDSLSKVFVSSLVGSDTLPQQRQGNKLVLLYFQSVFRVTYKIDYP